jgi:hypothetical protein
MKMLIDKLRSIEFQWVEKGKECFCLIQLASPDYGWCRSLFSIELYDRLGGGATLYVNVFFFEFKPLSI